MTEKNQMPEGVSLCPTCKGSGEQRTMFGTPFDCFECSGLGYVGDPIIIAAWFKGFLQVRRAQFAAMRKELHHLRDDLHLLHQIYPDATQAMEQRRLQDHMRKHSSKID